MDTYKGDRKDREVDSVVDVFEKISLVTLLGILCCNKWEMKMADNCNECKYYEQFCLPNLASPDDMKDQVHATQQEGQ